MERHTETATPTPIPIVGRPDPYDTDYACFVKAKDRGQPTFTLVAQDVSADLCVDFWIGVQLQIRQRIDDGMTVKDAVDSTRREYRVAPWSTLEPMEDVKLNGAMMIARAMRAFPGIRKVAD